MSVQDVTTGFADGAMGIVGLKSDVVLKGVATRVGAATPPFIAGMFVQGAVVRSSLKKLNNPKVANEIVRNTLGGSITIRSI